MHTAITDLISDAHAMFKYDKSKLLTDRQCASWAWNLFYDIKVKTDCRRTKCWAEYRPFCKEGAKCHFELHWVTCGCYHSTNGPLW